MKPGLAVLPMVVWADVFIYPWINRQQLAQIVHKFKERQFAEKLQKFLHDPKCGNHSLGYLNITSKLKIESSKCQVGKRIFSAEYCTSLAVAPHCYRFGMRQIYMDCEFPGCEMPENIAGFKELAIRHVDDQVLDFLDKIRPLFTDVLLNIGPTQLEENVRILLAHLLPMIGSIRAIICKNECIDLFERHFPGTLALAKELDVDLRATTPANIPLYLRWLAVAQNIDLHGPRFVKILCAQPETIMAIVDAVRKQFLEATTSSTFVIFLEIFRNDLRQRADKFNYENTATKEQMSVRNAIFMKPVYHGGGNINYVEIMRHPIGAEENMREWLKQKAYYEKMYKHYKDEEDEANEEDDYEEDEEYDEDEADEANNEDDDEKDEANDDEDDEERQTISIGWLTMTIGHITKKAGALDQGESGSNNDDDEAGPSTSAKKMKK